MPYTTNPTTAKYEPSNPLPANLKHKPVYALPYEKFDGMYIGDTDNGMRYISVGIAQWSLPGSPPEVSVKTMRYDDEHQKWQREAEELPLHRAIDATLFLAKVLFDQQNGKVEIPPNTFTKQAASISITSEVRSHGEMASYNKFLGKHSKLLKERLRDLANVLNSLIEAGKI